MGLIWPQPSCCFLGTLGILGTLEPLCILGILGILSALDTLGILGILDTLNLRTCFQKLVFWESSNLESSLAISLRKPLWHSHVPVDAPQLWAGVKIDFPSWYFGHKRGRFGGKHTPAI